MTEEINKEVQNIAQKIVKKYKPEKIILFGSYAWGNPEKSSDLDLFIIKKTKEIKRDRSVIVSRIIKNRNLPVDILVYTPSEVKKRVFLGDFFIKRILKEGKFLYEKK